MYNVCLMGCTNADIVCLMECVRQYETNVETCPCQAECPNGCPCPTYDCSAITTTTESIQESTSASTSAQTTQTTPAADKNLVLILNTENPANIPIIVNSTGFVDRNFLFVYEKETTVYKSCALNWKNELFVFGGEGFGQTRQLSKLIGYQLQRIGSLPFDHQFGSCTNMDNRKLFLCFQDFANDYRRCRYAYFPEGYYQEIAVSTFEHRHTQIESSDGMKKKLSIVSKKQFQFTFLLLVASIIKRLSCTTQPLTSGKLLRIIPEVEILFKGVVVLSNALFCQWVYDNFSYLL